MAFGFLGRPSYEQVPDSPLSLESKGQDGKFEPQVDEGYLPKRKSTNLVITVMTAVWCSILFGYNTGVISAALLKIEEEIEMTSFTKSTLVSIILIGAMAGSVLTAVIIDVIGRKKTILFNNFFLILGPLVAISTRTYGVLLLGRFITGLGVGVSSAVVPTYLSEVAPAHRRGALLMTRQLAVGSGIFLAYLSGVVFLNFHNGWRIMLGISTIPALWQIMCFRFLPESPRWLVSRNRFEEAKQVVIWCDSSLQTHAEADKIVQDIKKNVEASTGTKWTELLKRKYRLVLLINVFLNLLQQFTGINVIIYYSGTILKKAGFDEDTAVLISALLALPQIFLISLSLYVIDKVGRRPMLMAGLAGVILALGMVGFSFQADSFEEDKGAMIKWLSVGGLLIFKICFSLSIGPMPLTITAEISPSSIRGKALSLGSFLNWVANFIVQMTFLQLVKAVGDSMTWWIYAGFSVVILVFVAIFVPETKNVSLEELERRLVKDD